MESNSTNSFTLSFSKDTMLYTFIAVNFGLLIVFGLQLFSVKAEVIDPTDSKSITERERTDQKLAGIVPAGKGDYIKGDPEAVLSLIEYSDFECPYCQRFHQTAQQVLDAYEGRVNWVYRHFPLSSHAGANTKAHAVECAAEQKGAEGFWTYADALFESGTGTPLSQLSEIAQEIGLNTSDFEECMDSNKFQQDIDTDFASGQAAGVTGTPGNFIYNNKTGESVFIPGALPFPQVQEAINQVL